MAADPGFQTFSTRSIPQANRFDYWMSVMNDSLWRVTDWRDVPQDFNVDLCAARLGNLTTLSESISPHRSRRTRADLGKSEERSYHLFVSTAPAWGFTHRGTSGRLHPGDVLMLAEGEHETICPDGFRGVILKCPEDWMQTWLPDPEALAGHVIARESTWGKVLSPVVGQMTPELAAASPLPHQVLVDQLGAILALAGGEAASRTLPDLVEQIRECVRERCGDATLTADDIARVIDMPGRMLHRTLASAGTSFAAELVSARVAIAVSMLASRACRQKALTEIAQASGFADEAHLARVLRRRTGRDLLELRRPLC